MAALSAWAVGAVIAALGLAVRLIVHAGRTQLIRIVSLPRELAAELDLSVRDKYLELWQAVHDHRDE